MCFLCTYLWPALVHRAGAATRRRYELTGKIVAVEPEKHQVTVSHEDIKGYMPGMTMPFTVRDQINLKELSPNDKLTATLVVDGTHTWLEDLIVTHVSSDGSAPPAAMLASEGDEVPNFTLRNQDNREIHIRDYRGKALLLTFIYTRCPVPDYCTLMSNNFAQIDRALGQDPELYEKTHLLSISIDPGYDTPEVLKSYGAAHTERYREGDVCALGVCRRHERAGEEDRGVFWSDLFPRQGPDHSRAEDRDRQSRREDRKDLYRKRLETRRSCQRDHPSHTTDDTD